MHRARKRQRLRAPAAIHQLQVSGISLDSFFHILNPNRPHRGPVRRFIAKSGFKNFIWINRSSHPTHVETVVEWAVNENIGDLAVWGGDGTFSRVVHALYRFKKLDAVRLALIPVGTGNDFARHIFSPRWKDWLGSARLERFDAGLVSGDFGERVFVNNSGFGRSRNALNREKPKSFRDIFSFSEKKLEVEWGTEKIHQYETFQSIFGIVFNGPFFNRGLHFSRDLSAQDGLLTGYFAAPKSTARMMIKLVAARLGAPLASDEDRRIDADFIQVESGEPLFPQADGEPVTKEGQRRLRYTVLPGALNLRVPMRS